MDDFDISEWGGGFDLGDMGGGFDIGDIDFSGLGGGFDLSDLGGDFGLGGLDLGGLDLGEAISFGDVLGSLGDGIDFSNLGGGFDLGDMGSDSIFYDFGYGDLGYPDPQDQDGGFYGNIPGVAEYDPRTNSTILYNSDGSIRETIIHDERDYDVEDQPGGFYGNTKNATYDPKTNTTTIRDNDGNVVRTVYHSGGAGGGTGGGTGGGGGGKGGGGGLGGLKDNNALLLALLGGLLGLLGRGSASKLPVGYQGGIPKYTATRVPGRGVQYTRAAGGGLMDLAGGGQPARYLRGGTDGMADKIKTDIDGKQPARLSHGEFVIPADVVSHLGNGNSDAGADVLYEMMAKVRKARTGTPKQGKQINPQKYTPA